MKIKTISISSDKNHPNLLKLLAATKKHGFDHEVIYEPTSFWLAFGQLKKWCEENKNNYTHFIYTDGWDTYCLTSQEEFISKLPINIKLLCEAEKGCFPNGNLVKEYDKIQRLKDYGWKYVNAGQFFCEIEYYLHLCDKYSLDNVKMNQLWLSEVFLQESGYLFQLDYECNVFQSIAFESPDEYAVTRDHRLLNRKTNTYPIWIHDNGGGKNIDWIFNI